jgi:hypothetical protein
MRRGGDEGWFDGRRPGAGCLGKMSDLLGGILAMKCAVLFFLCDGADVGVGVMLYHAFADNARTYIPACSKSVIFIPALSTHP